MSALLCIDRVEYECTCSVYSPLSQQYFCRHCTVLRCKQCVSHELSHFFCSNCLESMPSAEARLKKNRCTNCYDCPICGCALAIRATSLLPAGATPEDRPSTEKSANPHKMYYYACNYCRWTTRQSGIPDQTQTQANWSDKGNKDELLLRNVQEHFRHLAAVEKSERERKKFSKRRNMGHFYTDKYGIKALIARKKAGITTDEKDESEANLQGTEASEDVEELDASVFTKELKLDSVTTMAQRHNAPLMQPENVNELHPMKRDLLVKKSLRCKECDHNLCKGEYNPTSTKFKIQLFAIFHAPEIRLLMQPEIVAEKPFDVCLTVSNLSASLMHIVLLPNLHFEEGQYAKAKVSETELVLAVRDETADIDIQDSGSPPCGMILWKRGHKIAIKLTATIGKFEGQVLLPLIVKYDYVSAVLPVGESKEPEIKWLQQNVIIKLGKTIEN